MHLFKFASFVLEPIELQVELFEPGQIDHPGLWVGVAFLVPEARAYAEGFEVRWLGLDGLEDAVHVFPVFEGDSEDLDGVDAWVLRLERYLLDG